MTDGSLADDPHEVRITSDGMRASVVVDDHDLSSSLSGYTLEQRANQPPLLVLYAKAHTDGVVFDGFTQVAVATAAPPAEAIAAFLTTVDAGMLQQAALNRTDLDGTPTELTTAILRQLAEWATGGSR
jgi:hypothetical protein